MMLEVVALLDDNEADLQKWQQAFQTAGIQAVPFTDHASFSRSLKRGDQYDAVILDWYFEDETSSVIARAVLEGDIRPNRYVPVFVYTNEGEAAKSEIQCLSRPFDRIPIFSKDVVDVVTLVSKVQDWYAASTSAKICTVWRRVRRTAFEQALYELDALEGQELQATLKHLFITEDQPHLDIDHAIEFLERFAGRSVAFNSELRGILQSVIGETQMNGVSSPSPALVHAHRYIPLTPNEKIVRTGDVVDVYDEYGEYLLTAVVITPACDLEQRKCRELRLLIAQKEEPPTRAEQWWHLEALRRQDSGVFENYWLNFHRILCLVDKAMPPDPKKSQLWKGVLTYDKVFQDPFGKQVRLKPICRLDDPYRSDLLQKFSSHAARVGIP